MSEHASSRHRFEIEMVPGDDVASLSMDAEPIANRTRERISSSEWTDCLRESAASRLSDIQGF